MALKASVETPEGALCVGDTWDVALPKIKASFRNHLVRVNRDCWMEVRQLGVDLAAVPDQSYELTWERRGGGPYTLVRIRQLDLEVRA